MSNSLTPLIRTGKNQVSGFVGCSPNPGTSSDEGNELKAKFEEAGATIELK